MNKKVVAILLVLVVVGLFLVTACPKEPKKDQAEQQQATEASGRVPPATGADIDAPAPQLQPVVAA